MLDPLTDHVLAFFAGIVLGYFAVRLTRGK
jgi:uncharacterized membrane-anchored protein YhcB (DUF1043 family)